ncbi:MAG: coenzyme F420-0:L-glutamate ligase [Patescibacteria group bacterium]
MKEPCPNRGKDLVIEAGGGHYARLPVKTRLVKPKDRLAEIVRRYAVPHLLPGDLLFVSEKIVAITQGRAFPIEEIRPSRLARFLVRFVYKSPHGIGLGSPWTMELALREVGAPRILFAAALSALTKLCGIRGVFYLICGKRVAAIDGPCHYTIPPYNGYAKLGPAKPDRAARELRDAAGVEVAIVDANDLGVALLGRSSRAISARFAREVFRDNPLGQSREQTPLCIVRRVPGALARTGSD